MLNGPYSNCGTILLVTVPTFESDVYNEFTMREQKYYINRFVIHVAYEEISYP